MTRDELISIIEEHTSVNDGLDFENGFAFYKPYVDGVDDAADAILARLELDKKISLLGNTGAQTSTKDKCVICGANTNGGTYGDLFPLCFACYTDRPDDIKQYVKKLEGQEQ